MGFPFPFPVGFLLRDPNGSVTPDPPSKKLIWTVKEGPPSSNTVVGDPTVNGAVLFVSLNFGTEAQCFDLPAAGWTPISTLGFKYKDPGPDVIPAPDVRGGMRVVRIMKTPSGAFHIKALASARKGPIFITTHPSNQFYAYLLIRGGDLYYSEGFDIAASVTTTEVKNAPAPGGCFEVPPDTFCSPSGAFLGAGPMLQVGNPTVSFSQAFPA